MAAICAIFFSFGSVGLCVRGEGLTGLKANAEAPCESAGFCELDDHEESVPVPENCCLGTPIGLDGKPQLAKQTRPRKTDSYSALMQTASLCTRSLPTAAEFGLLIQSQPSGSSGLSFLIRTVVLLL